MKPKARLDRGPRKRARPLHGLAIVLFAGTAWAVPGLNDACEQAGAPVAAIAKVPALEVPPVETSSVEAPNVEAPNVALLKLEPPNLAAPKPVPARPAPTQLRKSTAALTATPRATSAQHQATQVKGHQSAAAFDELTRLGSLDKTTVQRYIRHSEAKIKYCYERSMATHTHVGTVEVRFVITPEGTVASLTTTAIGIGGEVSSCVAAIMKSIEFPRSGSTVQVVYPFHFVLSDD